MRVATVFSGFAGVTVAAGVTVVLTTIARAGDLTACVSFTFVLPIESM